MTIIGRTNQFILKTLYWFDFLIRQYIMKEERTGNRSGPRPLQTGRVTDMVSEPRNPTISGLAPFNLPRFKAAMGYLSAKYGADLDPYRLVKFHVLIDALHVVKHGRPIIGGKLEAWKWGPVCGQSYRTVSDWIEDHDHFGGEPGEVHVVDPSGGQRYPSVEADHGMEHYADEFSPVELESIDTAWNEIGRKSFNECKHYFHEPNGSFLGAAWKQVRESKKEEIDWRDVIAEYEHWFKADCRMAKLAVAI